MKKKFSTKEDVPKKQSTILSVGLTNNSFDNSDGRPIYKKNEKYDQEAFNRIFDLWKLAVKIGNKKLAKQQMSMIYLHCEKFVYSELWKRYPSFMNSVEHRNDIIQEVWEKITEQLPNYDYTRASITVFISMWISHVVTNYYSNSFSCTSNYYSDAMQKVCAAENFLQAHNMRICTSTIVQMTGLPEVTVEHAQDLIRKKERVSYESMVIEQPSKILTPEATIIQNESTEVLNKILDKELNKEEILILQILTTPLDSKKITASYGEVVDRLNEHMKESKIEKKYNIPKVKKIVSRISVKLINSKEMNEQFPNLIREYRKMGIEGDMPLIDDKEFLDVQRQVLMDICS